MAFSSPMVPDTKMNGTSGRLVCAIASAERPSNPGIEKSERIMSSFGFWSAAVKVSLVWTRSIVASGQSRAIASLASSASDSESSRWDGTASQGGTLEVVGLRHRLLLPLGQRAPDGGDASLPIRSLRM